MSGMDRKRILPRYAELPYNTGGNCRGGMDSPRDELPSGVSGVQVPTAWGLPMFQATGKWISRLATDSRTVSTMCGLAAGTAWVSISAVWWSAYEPLWPARAAFAVAVIAALAIFSLSWVQAKLSRIPRFWRVGIASCGLASWPALWTLIATQRGTFPIGWFTQDLPSFAATTLLAMGAIFPAVLLGCLPTIEAHRRRSLPGGGTFWLGVAGAFAVAPTTLFARLPADRVLLLVAAAMLLGAGLSLVLKRDEIEAPAEVNPLTTTEQSGWQMLLSLAACAGVAVAIEAALRTSEQLVIDSLPFKLLGWAGFLTGVSVSTGLDLESRGLNCDGRWWVWESPVARSAGCFRLGHTGDLDFRNVKLLLSDHDLQGADSIRDSGSRGVGLRQALPRHFPSDLALHHGRCLGSLLPRQMAAALRTVRPLGECLAGGTGPVAAGQMARTSSHSRAQLGDGPVRLDGGAPGRSLVRADGSRSQSLLAARLQCRVIRGSCQRT